MQAQSKYQFECLSLMYYNQTNECILNYDTQRNGENSQFFSTDFQGIGVNYFDNLCAMRAMDQGCLPSCFSLPFLNAFYGQIYSFDTAAVIRLQNFQKMLFFMIENSVFIF